MHRSSAMLPPGPFRAADIPDKSPYELSRGHAILRLPPRPSRASARSFGAAVLMSDPAVEEVGTDAGFAPDEQTLRAPDVAVLPPGPANESEEGWIKGVPPLAVEYADRGQDEADLKVKIQEFLERGTREVWVVRLEGVRVVEVHTLGGGKPRRVQGHELLTLPGVLAEPIPAAAMYDRREAQRVIERNMLKRARQQKRDEQRAEGRAEGIAEGKAEGTIRTLQAAILRVFQVRGLAVGEPERARVAAESDPEQLGRWLDRAATASSVTSTLDD